MFIGSVVSGQCKKERQTFIGNKRQKNENCNLEFRKTEEKKKTIDY